MDRRTWKKSLAAASPAARHKFVQETPLWLPAAVLQKDSTQSIAAVDAPGNGVHWFRVTDSGIDREGDIILSAGMDIEQYKENGSLLWGHDPSRPDYVLGKPIDVVKTDTSIDVGFQFASEVNPLAAMVEQMVAKGFVRGVSVGIMIKEYTEANDRAGWMPINVIRSELLEISVTPVPANPRAVAQAGDEIETKEEDEQDDFNDAAIVVNADERCINTFTRPPADPVVAAFLKAARKG